MFEIQVRSRRRQANKKKEHTRLCDFGQIFPSCFDSLLCYPTTLTMIAAKIPEFTRQRDIVQITKCVKINRSYFWFEQKTDTANIYQHLVREVKTRIGFLARRLLLLPSFTTNCFPREERDHSTGSDLKKDLEPSSLLHLRLASLSCEASKQFHRSVEETQG